MKITVQGYKLNYGIGYYKHIDKNNIKPIYYSLSRGGKVLKSKKWIWCSLDILEKEGTHFIIISARAWKKDGQSDLGLVDKGGRYKTLKLSRVNYFLIKTYDKIFFKKIKLLKFLDKLVPIKKNLYLILLAVVLASIYYIINYFFDNYLQDLISKSNLIQSIIVFLSLSSIINIFHPFTLRKEVNIEEVKKVSDTIAEQKVKKGGNHNQNEIII